MLSSEPFSFIDALLPLHTLFSLATRERDGRLQTVFDVPEGSLITRLRILVQPPCPCKNAKKKDGASSHSLANQPKTTQKSHHRQSEARSRLTMMAFENLNKSAGVAMDARRQFHSGAICAFFPEPFAP